MQNKRVAFGCVRPPLINVPLDRVVADELHLLLQIGDVLVRNLVDEARDKDELQGISDPLRGPAINGTNSGHQVLRCSVSNLGEAESAH